MVISKRIAFTAAVLLMLVGCTDLTEFDHTVQAGISVIHPPDLRAVQTIQNVSGARSLCIIPDYFIVATTEGTAILFDLESHQQTGSFIIGNPSASGYFEMEYSPTESSVYIIGELGKILELHVPDMEIMDSFSVCETPVDIEVVIGKPYFYIAGATSCNIYEVEKESNILSRSCLLSSSPTCMAIDHSIDTILVGTLDDPELVSTIPSGIMRRRKMLHIPGIVAIETIPNDTTFCAVLYPDTANKITTIVNFFNNLVTGAQVTTDRVPIDGNIYHMCAESDGSHVYVLSYLGNNTSRLSSYNCSSYIIEDRINMQGYPLDIAISPGGTLLVLTTD